MDLRPELTEAIGVFFLVLLGCGAIMVDASGTGVGPVGISLTFGLVIMALVYALAPVSGAHFNPAVTLGFAATGHFPWQRVLTYVSAQVLGAIAAGLTLRMLLGNVAALGSTRRAAGVGLPAAFLLEVLATFLLALVIIGVATDKRAAPGSGLAIGGAVTVGSLAVGPLTGAGMNPARSLGPALASGTLGDQWLYVLAPLVGAVAAMMVFEFLRHGRVPGRTLGVAGPVDLAEAP